jgi:hypothetical protein
MFSFGVCCEFSLLINCTTVSIVPIFLSEGTILLFVGMAIVLGAIDGSVQKRALFDKIS